MDFIGGSKNCGKSKAQEEWANDKTIRIDKKSIPNYNGTIDCVFPLLQIGSQPIEFLSEEEIKERFDTTEGRPAE